MRPRSRSEVCDFETPEKNSRTLEATTLFLRAHRLLGVGEGLAAGARARTIARVSSQATRDKRKGERGFLTSNSLGTR